MTVKNAIVVGSGLGGMTAAYRLHQAGYKVTVFENEPHPAGRNRSVKVADCIIDIGATVMASSYDKVFDLIDEIGLADQLEDIGGNSAILREGRMHMMSIDNPNLAMIKSSIIGLWSKISLSKLVIKHLLHARQFNFHNLGVSSGCDTETLEEYGARNFPKEVYEYILNPTLKFIYLHNGKDSALIEFLWWMSTMGSGKSKSFKYGNDQLVKKLSEYVDVKCDHQVISVDNAEKGVRVTVKNNGENRVVESDVCIISTPAPITAQIYHSGLTDEQYDFISSRKYTKTTLVSFVTEKRSDLDALMIMVPDSEHPHLMTILLGHNIASTRSPADRGVILAFFDEDWSNQHAAKSDEDLMRLAQEDVVDIIPEVADIKGYHVHRWQNTAPLCEVGVCDKVRKFVDSMDPHSPVQIIGDYLAQSCMNVAVSTANRAVESIVQNHK